MFERENRWTIWGSALAVTALSWLGFKAVSRVTDRLTAPKPVNLETPLEELKGSSKADAILRGPANGNVAALYEKMCIQDPLQYKDDQRLPGVLAKYRRYLNGEVVDRSRKHMPSDIIEGTLNPDYVTYLTNQSRVQGNPKWIREELARVARIQEVATLKAEYTQTLLELGMPEEFIDMLLTAERIEEYSAEDWRNIAVFCKKQSEEYSVEILAKFLMAFPEKHIVFNVNSLEVYAVLIENGVPEPVSESIVRGKISMEQAQSILKLVAEEGYEWDEAVEQVTEDDAAIAEAAVLRARYASLVKGE